MFTIASAARVLAHARDAAGLSTIARACGFTGDPAPLDATARAALGLPAAVRAADVFEGRGILRALCVEVPPAASARETVGRLAITVQRRSPFAVWLVLATERRGTTLTIASAMVAPRPHAAQLIVDRSRVLDSDAETLRALAAAADGPELLVHARWCEILGREAITGRFFRALNDTVTRLGESVAHDVPERDARSLALLTTTRLLFLAFLEAKGWLDGDHAFLRRTWNSCTSGRGGYHRTVLLPLFFGTLNTPRSHRAPAARAFGRVPFLNGGLFTRATVERAYRRVVFPDAALGGLVSDLLGRWRFTAREHSTSHAEAAVDPEMLGRAFECLMASHARRSSGAYYTPRPVVARVFDAALDAVVTTEERAALASLRRDDTSTVEASDLLRTLANVTILDPACGSGAFLVHALDELATLRTRLGDGRDAGALRRDVLARQLFGVDREPTAVWLCELRLWLAVVVETVTSDPRDVQPLPNLDAQVRVGDALAGDAFARRALPRHATPLARLRERYARSTGARKRTLARALSRAERSAALEAIDARVEAVAAQRRELVVAMRGRDLFGERVRPDAAARSALEELRARSRRLRAERRAVVNGAALAFDWAAQFADIGARGGFDVVIGNPPWVRLHRIPPLERSALRSRFESYRNASWRAGAAAAGAGTGFAAQVDLAALFVERALALTKHGGTVSLLVPAKLWRSLAGGGIRQLLARDTRLVELEDWSEARATFDAAVYPSLVVARHESPAEPYSIRVAEHHRDRALRWCTPVRALAFDETPGAPWVWLPPVARDGFERVRKLGVALGEHPGLRPRLGVKCGCNDAFVVRRLADGTVLGCGARRGSIEPALLRPLLRGEDVTAWKIEEPDLGIVFAHDESLKPLRELPPLTRRWLLPWRSRLAARTDLRGRTPWWSVFRVDAADPASARVVWADVARTLRAAVIRAGDNVVPLNSCYVIATRTQDEACALAAWLNSPLAAAWLAALAEPARGGYRRMLGWTVALLPLPRDWDRAVQLLTPLGANAFDGNPPSPSDLLERCLEALGATHHQVEALLTWGHR